MSGVTRGLQLMADFLRLFVRALEHGNPEAVRDGIGVAKGWLAETVNATGAVKINAVSLLFGSDPWQDSRKMYRAYHDKWADKL